MCEISSELKFSTTPNQISQSSHSSNADLPRSTEVTLQQTPASSLQFNDQNQFSQLGHSPKADLHHSTEVTLQQTSATSLQIDDQNSSNAANDTFHSVGVEPSLCHRQLVPPIAHETTEIETPTNEDSSTSVLEHELATRRRECSSMSEALSSVFPQNQSTLVSQPRLVHNGKREESLKCTIFI